MVQEALGTRSEMKSGELKANWGMRRITARGIFLCTDHLCRECRFRLLCGIRRHPEGRVDLWSWVAEGLATEEFNSLTGASATESTKHGAQVQLRCGSGDSEGGVPTRAFAVGRWELESFDFGIGLTSGRSPRRIKRRRAKG